MVRVGECAHGGTYGVAVWSRESAIPPAALHRFESPPERQRQRQARQAGRQADITSDTHSDTTPHYTTPHGITRVMTTAVSPSPSSPSPSAPLALTQPPPNAYARFSRSWLVPGVTLSASLGASVGSIVTAVVNRPMLLGMVSGGVQLGACGFVYFGNLTLLSRSLPDELAPNRFMVHATSGASAGSMVGAFAGGVRGAARGTLFGAAVSVPIWFALEGRHRLVQIAAAARKETPTVTNGPTPK